jgi:hypothetical protein
MAMVASPHNLRVRRAHHLRIPSPPASHKQCLHLPLLPQKYPTLPWIQWKTPSLLVVEVHVHPAGSHAWASSSSVHTQCYDESTPTVPTAVEYRLTAPAPTLQQQSGLAPHQHLPSSRRQRRPVPRTRYHHKSSSTCRRNTRRCRHLLPRRRELIALPHRSLDILRIMAGSVVAARVVVAASKAMRLSSTTVLLLERRQ